MRAFVFHAVFALSKSLAPNAILLQMSSLLAVLPKRARWASAAAFVARNFGGGGGGGDSSNSDACVGDRSIAALYDHIAVERRVSDIWPPIFAFV